MGILKLTIAVGNPQRTNFEEVEVTVDTGSTLYGVASHAAEAARRPGGCNVAVRDC